MDFGSVLKNELFRPMATLVVPGAISIAPYLLLAGHYVPKAREFWQSNNYGSGLILLIIILAAGLILENFGSRIEWVWDRCLALKIRGRRRAWRHYVQLKTRDEVVGQRFLRTIHVRFKFELSMAPALFIFTIGLIWLNAVMSFWHAGAMAWFATFLFGLSFYLLKESYDSADQLGALHESVRNALRRGEQVPTGKESQAEYFL